MVVSITCILITAMSFEFVVWLLMGSVVERSLFFHAVRTNIHVLFIIIRELLNPLHSIIERGFFSCILFGVLFFVLIWRGKYV